MSTDIPGLITSRGEFHEALRAALNEAADAGSAQLWLSDPHFAEWPLGERAVVDALTRWAQSSRRLTMLAATFDEVGRRHPRWVAWRRDWSHIVSCRTNHELESADVPTLLCASGTVSVRLSDPVHHRGRYSHDKSEQLRCKELFDAVSQRSEEVFSATTTGL
jgi:hypothetical protein